MTKHALALAGTALLAAAAIVSCGGGAAAHPAQSPATGNIRVCEHYRTQRTFVLNDATPTLADAAKIFGWVSVDQVQAVPGTPLHRDLGRMLTAMQGHGGSTYATSKQVLADCEALGVKFTR